LGLGNPSESTGLPPRARDYRTDLTIRTCPVCFRDIKASDHTQGFMADHGFIIRPGYRTGHCPGTGLLPWETSCEPAIEEIESLLAYSATVVAKLAALESGRVKTLTANGSYDWKTQTYVEVVLTPADGRKWEGALKQRVNTTRREIAHLWGKHYPSIPWMRMAVRTWTPVLGTTPAVGAPRGIPEGTDFDGMPTCAVG